MTQMTLTFDAVSEATPGPKWAARWARSWPSYEAWFIARGGDNGPSRTDCRTAIERYMPELTTVYDRLEPMRSLLTAQSCRSYSVNYAAAHQPIADICRNGKLLNVMRRDDHN